MEKRNKRWRIIQRNRIYAAKMRLHANNAWSCHFMDDEGNRIPNPRWIDLYKANYNPAYKSVRTPCSCFFCKSERYDRLLAKRETKAEMDLSME